MLQITQASSSCTAVNMSGAIFAIVSITGIFLVVILLAVPAALTALDRQSSFLGDLHPAVDAVGQLVHPGLPTGIRFSRASSRYRRSAFWESSISSIKPSCFVRPEEVR
jgi:hypothetical protein